MRTILGVISHAIAIMTTVNNAPQELVNVRVILNDLFRTKRREKPILYLKRRAGISVNRLFQIISGIYKGETND
jgi:hypothetical protein